VHVRRQIQHCVALATLPEDPECVLMATGGTDSSVRLYVRNAACSNNNSSSSYCNGSATGTPQQQVQQPQQQEGAGGGQGGAFDLQCQLRGHENWVKGVTFTRVQEPAVQQGQAGRVSLLLASAGQDRYGRIWCISTDPHHSSAADGGAAGGAAAGHNNSAAGDEFLRNMIMR